MNVGAALLWLIICIFAIAVIWWLLTRIYQRSRSDVAFVRTGFLGRKVVISGGAFVFPGLHDVTGVNMNSVRIDIDRTGAGALISSDRLRVDVLASFNVRVGRTVEDVSAAAQTFGKRTLQVDVLRNLLENSFVDALRAVAADMTLVELHQHRKEIGDRIAEVLAPSLSRAGMELQSTSITKLDQTAREFFNPENAFDAAGLTSLTETIEELRRRRHEVEQSTQIAIERQTLESERQRLSLQRDQEFARLEQERELVVQRSREASASTQAQAEIDLETERVQLTLQQQVEQVRVDMDNQIEQFRARAEQEREKVRIEVEHAIQAERAEAERMLRQIEIDNTRLIEISEIDRRKQTDLAEQKLIGEIAEQAKLVAEIQIATEKAREQLARAEEAVSGAREVARAENAKSVETIATQLQAETISIMAQAESGSEELHAAATELRLKSEAAGLRARNEADNLLSPDVQAMRVRLQLIERLESIIRESVKPLERIEGLKIFDIRGAEALPGGRGASGADGASGNLSDQLVNAALRYRGQGPLLDQLMKEIGISGGNLVNLKGTFPELGADAATRDDAAVEDETEDD
jgi:uncharacterized membrane protein YqiK